MSTNKKNKLLVIVFSAGKPPIGSWHQRIKMFNLGFRSKGYDFVHIVPYYAPTPEAKEASPAYVKYCLKPKKTKTRNLRSGLLILLGLMKGAYHLLKAKQVKFIIVPGLNFLQGVIALTISKIRNIPFYAEIADENTHKYSETKGSLVDKLAKYNQIAYEKLILKKANKVFVFTSYLERKYKKLLPEYNNLFLTVPSLIDLEYFDSLKQNDPNEIKQNGIGLLNTDSVKIVYAGACNRTNGLFFFLDAAAKAKEEGCRHFLIFFFFVYGDVEKVKQYCLRKQLTENVLFFSPVLPKYIPAIYSKADILLLPEHGDVIANAGFPGKTSELLASQKAILATRFSDLDRYLTNGVNSCISDVGDNDAYFNNFKLLLSDANLRTQIAESARNTAAKHFDCKTGINIYLNG